MKTEKKWNRLPAVKSVFFDDFSEGLRGDVWRALNEKWASQHNNGYSDTNCMFTTDPAAVAAEGARGGLVVIRSQGDFTPDPSQKRCGGGIVTKRLFGPGKYEVRMKVAPRAGQCSAAWTYFNDWAPSFEARRYSEIDVELPYGGDWRSYSGTTYQNYFDAAQKTVASEVIEAGRALNDGEWHTFAFEWRTDRENGDEGVVWYQDSRPVLAIEDAVPRYTATFWVGTLFQDAIAWLGDPQFETAYLYVDWVRISEYEDPADAGFAEQESKSLYCGHDLGSSPVPHNDYIANGHFARPARELNFKGREIESWHLAGGSKIEDGALTVIAGGEASQTVTAQYAGFVFEVEIDAGTQDGVAVVTCECLAGKANRVDPELTPVGVCATELVIDGTGTFKTVFRIVEPKTEHIRLRIRGERGSVRLTRCGMTLRT